MATNDGASNILSDWRSGKISLWKVIIKTLEERDVDLCLLIVRELEDLTVPRILYESLYRLVVELSLRYGITDIYRILRDEGKLFIDDNLKERWEIIERMSDLSADEIMYHFYVEIPLKSSFDKSTEITQKLVDIMIEKEDEIQDVTSFIKDEDENALKSYFDDDESRFKEIAYYMVGLSNKDNLINIVENNKATILAMAEVGNNLVTKIVLGNPIILYEVKKRLIINGHDDLHGIDQSMILCFGSRDQIASLLTEDVKLEDVCDVEAFDIYLKKGYRNHEQLRKDMALIRYKIPKNIFTVLEKMNENNRYYVYDYTLDTRINRTDIKEINIVRVLSKIHAGEDKKELLKLMKKYSISVEEIQDLLPSITMFKDKIVKDNINYSYWIVLSLLYIVVALLIIFTIRIIVIGNVAMSSLLGIKVKQ